MGIHNKISFFFDKAFDWAIIKGPVVLIGFIILFLGLWLIKLIAKWLKRETLKENGML